ncbi:MAG: hypothetical protein GY765_28765 [bacterium]|nr:hypothetical protein [bacterium]
MKREEAIKIIKQFTQLVAAEFPVKQVVFYGAREMGSTDEHDEIEAAVVFDSLPDDYLECKNKLEETARRIDRRLEPIIIELSKNDVSGFVLEILKNGTVVYQA